MADQIVACPGCGKKFKIPDGAAPTGSFPCTACAKDVPWGKSAAPRTQGRAAPAAQPAKAAPSRSAPAKAAAAREPQAPVRQAPAAKGRRSRDDADDEPRQKAPKEEKLSGGMLATMIGVVMLVVIVIAMNSGKTADPEPVVVKPAAPATAQPVTPDPAAANPATATPATKPSTDTTPGTAPGTAGGTGESSGIGGTRNETKSSYGQWYRAPDLFAAFDSVDGVTPEERAKFDADAALFANPDAGREATVAGGRLKKAGRKAVPSILGEFGKHWNAGKWATDAEKQSSFQLQSLLKELVKASDPTKGFVARWTRGVDVAPSEFEKAARIWCAWWRSEGKDLTEFKPYAE